MGRNFITFQVGYIEIPITHTYIFNESQSGITGVPYICTFVKGMYHNYSNDVNFPLYAPKLFWDFFKQSVLVSTTTLAETDSGIYVFANPTT
ncbi:MAG: hypothetical protein ABIO44_11860 [Saprospiraceae bacterium]